MSDFLARIAENLANRVDGPLHFRLVLQPLIALTLAIVDGLKDARTGRPPYLWSLVAQRGGSRKQLQDGWKSIGKVFLVALVLDVLYQVIVLGFVYSGEALVVAFVLSIIPYGMMRELIARIAPKPRFSARSCPRSWPPQ